MDVEKRSSMKLDIEGVRLTDKSSPKIETYRNLGEDQDRADGLNGINGDTVKNSNMVREKIDPLEDGADEQMLGAEENEKLTVKDEVKFISADHQKNGDAKIDIISGKKEEQTFTGMTKDELMKYAEDPFWVRLRWFLFIFFWALWVAMLVGAILIIFSAPKCVAPKPLSWWQQGPLVTLKTSELTSDDVNKIVSFGAKGVVFELPGDETYYVNTPIVEEKIKKIIADFKDHNINVVLDLVPNYVTADDELFKEAKKNPEKRSPFIWTKVPNNWLSLETGSAWSPQDGDYFLNQFGPNRYDLQMSDKIAKEKLIAVFKHLTHLGVKGFRLGNVKHFIINSELKDEIPSNIPNTLHTEYGFFTHTQTTFQDGLGDLLREFKNSVLNMTNDEGFLSVTQDMHRPEAYKTKLSTSPIDLPMLGRLPRLLAESADAGTVEKEFQMIANAIGKTAWLQWSLHDKLKHITTSEYYMFTMLLPGVPVIPVEDLLFDATDKALITKLTDIRSAPSYMHGNFDIYTDSNKTVVAYTRVKMGNPGYFVLLNPSDQNFVGNFSDTKHIAPELTVFMLSSNYNSTGIAIKEKIPSDRIPVSPYSAIILTYAPKSDS